jgi:hypothetical protein
MSLSPKLKHVIGWLHAWAKDGFLPQEQIEQMLNTYLAVPALLKRFSQKDQDLFTMPLSETPCFENIPNVWFVVRDIFKNMFVHSHVNNKKTKKNQKNMLHYLFAHALPCFHETNKPIQVDEYVGVVWNLLLALLLGLYPQVMRKPHFIWRCDIFVQVHKLMTSNTVVQQDFITHHHSLIVLACMEYCAQVIPKFWPAEYEFLMKENNNMHLFFEKVPLLCDELRSMESPVDWGELEVQAESKIHKCCRTRRLNKAVAGDVSDVASENNHHQHARVMSVPLKKKNVTSTVSHAHYHGGDIQVILDCPVLTTMHSTQHEYTLLAHAYQVPASMLQEVHKLLQVYPLPLNIKQLQWEKMSMFYSSCVRTRWIASRLHVCMQCLYTKNHLHNKFRLNVFTEKIVCSECLSHEVVSLDMLGRIAVILNVSYILCPQCYKVHPYHGDKGSWLAFCPLASADPKEESLPLMCEICSETAGLTGYERVNHLTGEMQTIGYCSKHHPAEHAAKECWNVRQMKEVILKKKK